MYLRAVCLSEMRKDRVHLFEMQLDSTNFEIKGSTCGFPAGCGRYKHVAALCYALDELQSLPDFQSVTKHLPTWNQPKAKKLNPLPVINLQTRKEELLPPTKHSLAPSLTHSLQSTGKLTEKISNSEVRATSTSCSLWNDTTTYSTYRKSA